jgi:hypothetical protein
LEYSRQAGEPFASQSAMHADMIWAADGAGSYAPPKRDVSKKGTRKAGKKKADADDEP